MKLLLVGSGGFDLGSPLIGFFCHAKQLFRNAVCKSRHCAGYGQSFFTVDGKVDDVVVNCVIANKAACVSNLRQCGRQIERFDFLREVPSLGFRSIHHALNADSQHRARCSRGQIDDALRLFENFFCILRHAVNSRDSRTCWVGNFSTYFKRQFFAIRTSPKTDKFWRIKLALVCVSAKTCAIGSAIVVSIGSQFTSLKETFQDRVLGVYRSQATVRASHGFSFCHRRHV